MAEGGTRNVVGGDTVAGTVVQAGSTGASTQGPNFCGVSGS